MLFKDSLLKYKDVSGSLLHVVDMREKIQSVSAAGEDVVLVGKKLALVYFYYK